VLRADKLTNFMCPTATNSESPNKPAGVVRVCRALLGIMERVERDMKRRLCWWEV
jgi:hypothetical protein